jgi:DhnA family fructose-bisphosphate aldolase class Ia
MTLASPGKAVRLSHLFHPDTERTVIVALDHGLAGTRPGLEDLPAALEHVLRGRPDGIVLSAAALSHLAGRIRRRAGIVCTIDTFLTSSIPRAEPMGEAHRMLASVEGALALGADAVKVFLVGGQADLGGFADNVARVAETARACERTGVPLIVEPTLWGQRVEPARQRDPALVAHMCRIAFETGADVLKIPYPGPETLGELVSALPCPILIMGGSAAESIADTLAFAGEAVAAGARGIVFGQRVWQSPDPADTVRALYAAVHGKSVASRPNEERP